MKWALVLICLLASCGRRQPVRLALQPPSTNNYPSYFASWLGFYKEEGVEVEISQVAGASKILEAVVGGSADVGGGVYEQTIQMAAQGKSIVAFVSLLKSPNFAVIGGPGVHKLADLRGKMVGVSSVGSPSQFYLNHLLKNVGVNPSEVSTASVGMGATAMAALEGASGRGSPVWECDYGFRGAEARCGDPGRHTNAPRVAHGLPSR